MGTRSTAAAFCWGLAVLGCGGKAGQRGASPAPAEGPVASGRQPDDATGAVESVSLATGQHVETVEELLQGQVAGLQVIQLPNGDVSLRIRGTSSLRNDGEPLLVIDGMPVAPGNVTRALRSLRPQAVETIQVLKDVSSTSVYGAAGASGVILITTKHE